MHSIVLLYDKSFAFSFFIRLRFYSQYWVNIRHINCLFECHSLIYFSLFGLWFLLWFILRLFCRFRFLLIRLETLHPIVCMSMYAFSSLKHKYKRLLEIDFVFISRDMNKCFPVLSRAAFAIDPPVVLIPLFFNLTLICDISVVFGNIIVASLVFIKLLKVYRPL